MRGPSPSDGKIPDQTLIVLKPQEVLKFDEKLKYICVLKQDYNRHGTPLHLGETIGETRRNRLP